MAAGIAIAVVSAGSAWFVRGALDSGSARLAAANPGIQVTANGTANSGSLTGFARRAAVAHLVYSPDVRRPVELGADQSRHWSPG
jgi:hypothetical protein